MAKGKSAKPSGKARGASAGRNASKQSKKFISSGALAASIKDRKRKQEVRRKIDNRKQLRGIAGRAGAAAGAGSEDEGEGEGVVAAVSRAKEINEGEEEDSGDEMLDDETLQALLGDAHSASAQSEDEQEDEDEEDIDDEDLEAAEEKHRLTLQALREKDPEFYSYLKENDAALLDFGQPSDDSLSESGSASVATPSKSSSSKPAAASVQVTKPLLESWQKQMLAQRSLKALRRLLEAFRVAAASTSQDDEEEKHSKEERFEIKSSAMWLNTVTAAVKYTPLVVGHHLPAKEVGQNGKFKIATQSKKYAVIQRLLKLYFTSLHALLSGLSASAQGPLIALCVVESSRLLPYIVSSRPLVKAHLRLLLQFWSSPAASAPAASAADELRLSAFLGIRKLCLAADRGAQELCLKGCYLSLQQAARGTSPYSLPGLQMMKNTAGSAQLFAHPALADLAYTVGFSYIRTMAVTLRNTMKATSKSGSAQAGAKKQEKGKEPYRQVYNWAFVHSLDFWATVLASAASSGEGELQALVYPLVQVTLGVIKLHPSARYYPLRFHLLSSLLRVSSQTGAYVPLAPFLLEILDSSTLTKKPKPAPAGAKPLEFAFVLAAPANQLGTKVYADALVDELAHALLEFLTAQSNSIAFPELALPLTLALRRHAKKTRNAKLGTALRALVERTEANASWIEKRREKVEFSPTDRKGIQGFERNIQDELSPLKAWLKTQRKIRDPKRELVERSLRDNGEIEKDAALPSEDEEDDEGAMEED